MIVWVAVAWAQPVDAIGFGSCLDQTRRQPIWDAVITARPAAFFLLGDAIYGDSPDPAVLAREWSRLAARKDFARFRSATPLYGVWDDHDYGLNDAGVEFVSKDASRDLVLDFYEEADDSPRRTQEGGIYSEVRFDDAFGNVQVLLLDTRWNRTPLRLAPEGEPIGQGPYAPTEDPSATILGEAQWVWLAEQLAEPADLRIVGSSIPVLPEFTGWETWANVPAERTRLLDLLASAGNALIVSGDTHWHELSTVEHGGRTLWEFGTSGMTHRWRRPADNAHRYAGHVVAAKGFGLVGLDWQRRELVLEVRGVDGRALFSKTIGMDGTDVLPEPMAEPP